MKIITQLFAVALLVLLAGCSSTGRSGGQKQAHADVLAEIQASLTVQQKVMGVNHEPPAEVLSALIPAATMGVAVEDSVETFAQRFDLAVSRVPAQPFFTGLVEGTPFNIVVHQEVKGRVSLDLKNVTVEEVLDIVRDIYGYEYQEMASGFVILPARIQSKIFHVNYLNIKRGGESNTRVSSGQVSDVAGSTSSNNNNNSSNNNNNNNNSSGSSSNSRNVTSSNIQTSSESDFWSTLSQTVSSIIGSGKNRSVVVDSLSGLVVVRAMPGELRDVGDYLTAAQKNLQRQVILEAKIVEVTLNDAHRTGIDWAAIGRHGTEAIFAGNIGILNGTAEVLNTAAGTINTAAAFSAADFASSGNLFTLGFGDRNFGALLRLLNTQGEVEVLSSPRVSTLNNQKAIIKVGSDEFFVTEVSSTTTTGTSTTTTPNIELTPFFSGIALDVTPQISANDEVILHIHPTVSEVVDQSKTITVGGQVQTLPLAFSTVRESDSVVRAKNGQLIIIGGLMQNSASSRNSKTPGLGDIPLLGGLFKQSQGQNKRSELVILLKPIVVNNDNVWESAIKRSNDRVKGLSQ
ncbi:MAG: pilus (MSHA type) biogenesis protein MshL [Gammaproteobacteria bacterium]|nr:pilus (MSHA type) biogenesis protein MshL [Gammaproteobacteria bacterium]